MTSCENREFRHSSNSRKLSRQKFHNELAWVFTAHYASKKCRLKSTTTNGWRHFGRSERRKSFVLFPIQSEKSPDSGFFTCDPTNKCIMPSSRERHKGLIGRGGHDLRLTWKEKTDLLWEVDEFEEEKNQEEEFEWRKGIGTDLDSSVCLSLNSDP